MKAALANPRHQEPGPGARRPGHQRQLHVRPRRHPDAGHRPDASAHAARAAGHVDDVAGWWSSSPATRLFVTGTMLHVDGGATPPAAGTATTTAASPPGAPGCGSGRPRSSARPHGSALRPSDLAQATRWLLVVLVGAASRRQGHRFFATDVPARSGTGGSRRGGVRCADGAVAGGRPARRPAGRADRRRGRGGRRHQR